MAQVGKRVIDAIAFSVSLVGSVRQQGDSSFSDMLWRLHEGDGSQAEADWRALNARALQSLSPREQEEFLQAEPRGVRLFAEKKKAQVANLVEVKGGFHAGRHEAICNVPATHRPAKAKSSSAEAAMGLQASLWLGLDFPMMVVSNLWTKAGVTNGLRGDLYDLICVKDPWEEVPAVALLKVLRSDVRGLPEFLPRITSAWPNHTLVPVPVLERQWMVGSVEYSRRQLPLRGAFAITVHKSQGMTILKVILDPGANERQAGILFTGLSRVPSLQQIALSNPMDLTRLNAVFKSRTVANRIAWERARWHAPELALKAVMRNALAQATGTEPPATMGVDEISLELARVRRLGGGA